MKWYNPRGLSAPSKTIYDWIVVPHLVTHRFWRIHIMIDHTSRHVCSVASDTLSTSLQPWKRMGKDNGKIRTWCFPMFPHAFYQHAHYYFKKLSPRAPRSWSSGMSWSDDSHKFRHTMVLWPFGHHYGHSWMPSPIGNWFFDHDITHLGNCCSDLLVTGARVLTPKRTVL